MFDLASLAGHIEFQRWLGAGTIAVLIAAAITGLAFLLQGMLRSSSDQNDPQLAPGWAADLLDVVGCNSRLCLRYSELISSCVGQHSRASPCAGLSRFVCGDGKCFGYDHNTLVQGFLRALAAHALATWFPLHYARWPAVDRAASLYKTCVEAAAEASEEINPGDILPTDEVASFLALNESASELMMRLAARYQDGAFFWLDVEPLRRGDSKRRLQLKANEMFQLRAKTGSIFFLARRKPESRRWLDILARVFQVWEDVHKIWSNTSNLDKYEPLVLQIWELDRYGLSSAVLLAELNRDTRSYRSDDEIEVSNQALLQFLRRILSLEDLTPCIAWEFIEHRRGCFGSVRVQERTLADACFNCIERVAGLAAHAPFLLSSYDFESQTKFSLFSKNLKENLIDAVEGANWLPTLQKQSMMRRLLSLSIVCGLPAAKDGMEHIDSYYSYLPDGTGHFAHDFDAAVHAAWKWRRSENSTPFPLLSTSPNVLTATDTVYVPAVLLVPPLFTHGYDQARNFGFLGVALTRAFVHVLGLTTLRPLVDSGDEATARHVARLGQCLGLDQSKPSYASRLADIMALEPTIRAFREYNKTRLQADPRHDRFFVDMCLISCTPDDLKRCERSAVQTQEFWKAFECEGSAPVSSDVPKCAVW
ncbi:uncharacterized protein LOC144173361 [Haemaphysalis longicornis]